MHPSDLAVAAGAAAASPLVADLGLCLVAAALLSVAFVKLRIPAIAALLVAGVVLGPAGLHAIADRSSIDAIANLASPSCSSSSASRSTRRACSPAAAP